MKEIAPEIAESAKSIMDIQFKGVRLPVTVKIHKDFSMEEKEDNQ